MTLSNTYGKLTSLLKNNILINAVKADFSVTKNATERKINNTQPSKEKFYGYIRTKFETTTGC